MTLEELKKARTALIQKNSAGDIDDDQLADELAKLDEQREQTVRQEASNAATQQAQATIKINEGVKRMQALVPALTERIYGKEHAENAAFTEVVKNTIQKTVSDMHNGDTNAVQTFLMNLNDAQVEQVRVQAGKALNVDVTKEPETKEGEEKETKGEDEKPEEQKTDSKEGREDEMKEAKDANHQKASGGSATAPTTANDKDLRKLEDFMNSGEEDKHDPEVVMEVMEIANSMQQQDGGRNSLAVAESTPELRPM